MDQRKLLRRCGAAILLAAAMQFFIIGTSGLLQSPGWIALLIYAQTGRVVGSETEPPAETLPPNFIPPTEITQPSEKLPEAVVSFSQQDLELIRVRYSCDYRPNLQELLRAPLHWDLSSAEPTVLIIHTHATECYSDGDHGLSAFRTKNAKQNMLAVGAEVARVLTAGGIRVIHDTTLHDYPNYNGSYDAARATVQKYLQQYPSIRLVLDLHRDAIGDNSNQLITAGSAGGQRCSQLMLVMGTDAAGFTHPNWQENLSVGLKLAALLEQENPGITRSVTLSPYRYNMDLCSGSLLVEVGGAGDRLQEALIAANALAQAILTLAHGSS